MIERLEQLKRTYEGATMESLRAEIEALSEYFLHRQVVGCSNCYSDALIELINYKIMDTKQQYRMVAGVLLEDANPKMQVTCIGMTDEIAVHHLKKDATLIRYFYQFPKDWKKDISPTTKK